MSCYRACPNCSYFFNSLCWIGFSFLGCFFFFFVIIISWFKKKNVEISQNCRLASAGMTEAASGSHWGILTGQFQWWQKWQRRNVLPLKEKVCSTVGYPDSWYVTLWLTRNHRSSDSFPSLCNFPSSAICFSFAETKLFTLLFLWKHGIPEGLVGSINQ